MNSREYVLRPIGYSFQWHYAISRSAHKTWGRPDELIRQGQSNGLFPSETEVAKLRDLATECTKYNEEIDQRVVGSIQARAENDDRLKLRMALHLIKSVADTYCDDPAKLSSIRGEPQAVRFGDELVDDTDIGMKRYIVGNKVMQLKSIWHSSVPKLGK